MDNKTIETLEKQLELLSERSRGVISMQELSLLTAEIIGIARLLLKNHTNQSITVVQAQPAKKSGAPMKINRAVLIAELNRQGMNMNDLAKEADLSITTVQRARCGKLCTPLTVYLIAQALDKTVEELTAIEA